MQNDGQQGLFQFVIALVVLIGGGLLMAFYPGQSDRIFPVMTLVVGFYFSFAASKSGATTAIRALTAVAPAAPAAPAADGQAGQGDLKPMSGMPLNGRKPGDEKSQ